MDNLEYSTEAINVLDQFYEVNKILYVEGIDDKVFWEILFSKYYPYTVEIIEVNGVENLKPYIEAIESNSVDNSYVACDQDFNLFTNKQWHDNIICTFGHSIENSLLMKENICDVIRTFSKHSNRSHIAKKFDDWLVLFLENINDLLYCDIYNEKNKLGNSIMRDNCSSFLANENSAVICEHTVKSHLLKTFNEEEIDNIKNEIKGSFNFSILDFIRGHFLFSIALKFVSVLSKQLTGKTMSMAKDAFLSAIFIAFEKNLSKNPHLNYYETKIQNLS